MSAACPIVISGEWSRASILILGKDEVIHRDDIHLALLLDRKRDVGAYPVALMPYAAVTLSSPSSALNVR